MWFRLEVELGVSRRDLFVGFPSLALSHLFPELISYRQNAERKINMGRMGVRGRG